MLKNLDDLYVYRTEHTMILAPSGAGKTQLIQAFLALDLPAVIAGDRSVIVIDSQRDLIRTIKNLAIWRDHPDRLVLIDPTKNKLALNLFNVGEDRTSEAHINALRETYKFIVDAILRSSEFTGKQTLLFDMLILLMLEIPNATIHTFLDLLSPTGILNYTKYIQKLKPSPRKFFETVYLTKEGSKQYDSTREEVSRRLWQILANTTFDEMFSQPETRVNIGAEMDKGRCILIDTNKDFFGSDNSAIFGAFFIAQLRQAVMARDGFMKCHVYIDEAGDYLKYGGSAVDELFRQARKRNVGITVAMQNLKNIENIHDTIVTNTQIKFAANLSVDARAMAFVFGANDPKVLMNTGRGTFIAKYPHAQELDYDLDKYEAAYKRDRDTDLNDFSYWVQYTTYQVPFGLFNTMSTLTPAEQKLVEQLMRNRYGVRQPQPIEPTEDPRTAQDW